MARKLIFGKPLGNSADDRRHDPPRLFVTESDVARDFLWRYPSVITDADDPIQIIRGLVRENEALRKLLVH